MPRQYRSRNISVTAAGTKTQLTTLGSESSPGALIVPQGAKALIGVIAVAAPDNAAAGVASSIVRLEGSGLPDGPETLSLPSVGNELTTGARSSLKAELIPIAVPVTAGNEILLFGEMAGDDIGALEFGVTLVFA